MREELGEVSLDRGEPIEDASCLFFREPDKASLVQDERHVMQKVCLLRMEIPLIQIVKCEEILEGDVLQVRPHCAVESDTREADRVGRKITEPSHVSDCLSDLKCGDWEDLFIVAHDKQGTFLP